MVCRRGRAAGVAAVVSVFLYGAAWAGPITPPPGPEPRMAINDANTPGDADSVYRINKAGSYYLTEPVIAGLDESAIEIAASNVAIDLNGFVVGNLTATIPCVRLTATNRTDITIRNGVVSSFGGGIDVAGTTATEGGLIENVHVAGTTGTGIRAGSGTVVNGCSAVGNIFFGIRIGNGGSVVDSTARENGTNGIEAPGACLVRGNICMNNGTDAEGGAGILIEGDDCRIEGNHCGGAGQERGIDVDGAESIIIRNTCGDNGINWTIATNNGLAPIVSMTRNSSAVSGSTYSGGLGSTDPNANFTY